MVCGVMYLSFSIAINYTTGLCGFENKDEGCKIFSENKGVKDPGKEGSADLEHQPEVYQVGRSCLTLSLSGSCT